MAEQHSVSFVGAARGQARRGNLSARRRAVRRCAPAGPSHCSGEAQRTFIVFPGEAFCGAHGHGGAEWSGGGERAPTRGCQAPPLLSRRQQEQRQAAARACRRALCQWRRGPGMDMRLATPTHGVSSSCGGAERRSAGAAAKPPRRQLRGGGAPSSKRRCTPGAGGAQAECRRVAARQVGAQVGAEGGDEAAARVLGEDDVGGEGAVVGGEIHQPRKRRAHLRREGASGRGSRARAADAGRGGLLRGEGSRRGCTSPGSLQ